MRMNYGATGNKTRVAFVKPSKEPIGMYYSWCDGLWGAIKQLHKVHKFNVDVYGLCDQDAYFERDGIAFHMSNGVRALKYRMGVNEPKVILGWGTSYHKWHEIEEEPAKLKVLLYAGGEPDNKNARKYFDEVVVENESDAKHFDNCPAAFGTNTDTFYPMDVQKEYPSIYPAAFALWKRQDLWAKAMPAGSLAIGQKQEHEKECYEVCKEYGHEVMDLKDMTTMVEYYNRAEGVCLTPTRMGGCQRAALEAMACNVPVLATEDSKAAEFDGVWACKPEVDEIREAFIYMVLNFYNSGRNLRDEFIVGKLDHHEYARKLNEIIRSRL